MLVTEHYKQLDISAGDLTVTLYYMEATGYALAHNRIPVIPLILAKVSKEAAKPTSEAEISIRATVDGNELFNTGPITIPALKPGQAQPIETHSLTRVHTSAVLESVESRPGDMDVFVRIGENIFDARIDLRVLAPNEWFNSYAYFESLTAFIQPNAPEIVPILDKVATILEKRTGNSSISGYQEGSQRVIEIAAAIYEALQEVGIRYINPPASFENTGQRVRSSTEVLTTRFGTCVDLSLTFAAVAEQCGLHPVILMVPRHALTGILMTDDPLPSPVEYHPTVINNYLRSGRVLPIDAVYYSTTSFAKVVDATRTRYLDAGSEGLIDVVASHRDGIRPLPPVVERAGAQGSGNTLSRPLTSAEQTPVPFPPPSTPTALDSQTTPGNSAGTDKGQRAQRDDTWELPSASIPANEHSEKVPRVRKEVDHSPARIKAWKRELLDLSMNNRLLNMNSGPEVLHFHLSEGTLADLDDKIHAGEKIAIHPHDDISDNRRLQGISSVTQLPQERVADDLINHNRLYAEVPENRYQRYFRALKRSVRTYLEETGSGNLYLSLGALVHTTSPGRVATAPLFLIPVKIVEGRGRSRFHIQVDSTQEASPNYSLVEWLKQEHDVTIEALSQPRLDVSGLDIAYALSAISDALIQARLPFTVTETSYLLIARFSTYGMWKDLRDHWEVFMEAPVFAHLTNHAGSDFPDPAADVPLRDLPVDETEMALPIPADGAQMKAIKAAAQGYSFVLEGPPGTGKSQTITNLIAHALDQGKSVLFVAEKQAALDVVQGRLAKIGLSPFTIDLHGGKRAPSAIKRQLKESIDAEVFYDFHAWDMVVTNLRSRLSPLLEYPGRIHDVNGVGYSLWSAASALLDYDDGPTAQISESFVARPQLSLETVREKVGDLAVQARITDFDMVARWSLVGEQIGANFHTAWQRLEQAYATVNSLAAVRDFVGREDAQAILTEVQRASSVPAHHRLTVEQRQVFETSAQRLTVLADHVHRLHTEVGSLGALFPAAFIQAGDTGLLLEAIAVTRSGIFGRKKKLARYEQVLKAVLRSDVAPVDIEGAHSPDAIEGHLLRLPQLRAVAHELRTALDNVPHTEVLHGRSTLDPELPNAIRQRSEELAEAARIAEENAQRLGLLYELEAAGLDEAQREAAGQVLDAWHGWLEVLGANRNSVEAWQAGRTWVDAWLTAAAGWADDVANHGVEGLHRVAQWKSASQPLHTAELGTFMDQIESGHIGANDIEMAFHRGLATASIAERSSRSLLNDFHPELKGNELAQLKRALDKVREEIKQALPARLLKRRPYTAGNLDGRVAVLRRQLDAQRNAKSFRMLLQEYGEEILTVAPCFFVSPASLATFVPPEAVKFDIVVFDEASQVTVDQAMGALGRGKSAVIVGDSKQMPPTRIGKTLLGGSEYTSDDDDNDGDPMAGIDDLESILSEAVESGLPQLWLSWHYRSKDETLISFSNDHYYQGKLSSLPSPGLIAGAGISVVRVNGQFIRDKQAGRTTSQGGVALLRTNPVEANAIVDSITRRLNDPVTGRESIGVVTFNIQQRDLILDLLEQSTDPLVRDRLQGPDGIFVKNLENVQGDERDVILFSTAFSKRENGGLMPMNFGPLTRAGGERRLNVAITRARKEVEVFCSFDPQEIDFHRTKSLGMRHLREYLEAGLAQANQLTTEAAVGEASGQEAAGAVAAGGTSTSVENATSRSINDNKIRDDIAHKLRERGWVVATEFGKSAYTLDLVVRPQSDTRWHAAILTDGEKWARMPTVADRDLTPILLESLMEWAAVIRVWLPEWLADPKALLTRIETELHAAGERIRDYDERTAHAVEESNRVLAAERERLAAKQQVADSTDPEGTAGDLDDGVGDEAATDGVQWATEVDESRTGASAPQDDLEPVGGVAAEPVLVARPVSAGDVTPTVTAYVALPTDPLGEVDELEGAFLPARVEQLRAEILQNLQTSAPVRLEALQLSIAQRFGRQRTSPALKAKIDLLIPADHIKTEPESGLKFVWPSVDGARAWPHFRRSTGRSLTDIPIEEIRNAIRVLAKDDPEALLPDLAIREAFARSVLRVFGISRYTRQARERIDEAIRGL